MSLERDCVGLFCTCVGCSHKGLHSIVLRNSSNCNKCKNKMKKLVPKRKSRRLCASRPVVWQKLNVLLRLSHMRKF